MRTHFVYVIFSLLFLTACTAQSSVEKYDLLITNARVIDGTGSKAFDADIMIHNGIIEQIGDIDHDQTKINETVDAGGRVVSPGFIDMHSHGNPLNTPLFQNFLSMGVTTLSLGQDGRSVRTSDVAEWMNEIAENGLGPNILHFQGHGTLRNLVDAPLEKLDEEYIRQMQQLMDKALQAGSFGMTTGLEYQPGSFADLTELVEVAKPIASRGGLVMSHIRNEDNDKVKESIQELLEQGRLSGADVHVSHIKIVFGNDISHAEDILALMEEARSDGIRITADIYPYHASYTGIGIVFPDWAKPPHKYNEVVETRREELEEYIRNRVEARNGPEATLFGTSPWTGKTLAEVADSLNKPFEKVLVDDIGPRGAGAAYFVMNEEVVRRFLQDPHVMISSDGSPTMQHPRSYGSFAKIIDTYVNNEQLFPIEEAIRKMTGLPAATLGLDNTDHVITPRGIIREGFAADLLIFEPENIKAMSTFDNPHQLAEGFDWVFVNGKTAIREGSLDGRHGIVIKKLY
ncbi:MAG: amidohydrolase family protein [Balneolaceae bacterium]